jgi:hypothetical protein
MYDPRNATASWSWYLHQWKIGIFVALKKLFELINWKSDEDEIERILGKWRIIYENAEDFDIQEKDDSWPYVDSDWIWRVDSRHQVKAYKDGTAFSDYKNVLWVQHCIMNSRIRNWKTAIVREILVEWFQIKTFYETTAVWECRLWEIEVDENHRFLHTIVDVPTFKWKNQNLSRYPNANHYTNNPNNVQRYRYPNWLDFCDIDTTNDQIKEWCNEEIEKIKWDNLIGNIYEKLLYLLDEKIRYVHVQWWSPILYLLEIYNFIKGEHNKIIISKLQEIREAYSYYYEEYKKWDISIIVPSSSSDRIEIIDKYMERLYTLNDKDFFSRLKRMNFDQNIEKFTFPNIDWFRDVVLKFIWKLSILTSLEDLDNILNKYSLKMSCINQDSDNLPYIIKALENNIKSWNLSNDDFEWYCYINRNIDFNLEKFNSTDSEDVDLIQSWHYIDDFNKKLDNPNVRTWLWLIARESVLIKINSI